MFRRKRDEDRSPGERARRAQLGILARLLGCAYLIYIVFQLVKKENIENSNMNKTTVIVIAVLMSLAAAVVIGLTVVDWIRNWKAGKYSIHTYYQEELDAEGLEYNEKGELVPKGQGLSAPPSQQDEYEDSEDEYEETLIDDEGYEEEIADEPDEDDPDDGAGE